MKISKNIKGKIKRNLVVKKNKKKFLNIKHYIQSYFILNENKKLNSLPNYYIRPTFKFNRLFREKPQYLNTFPILIRKTKNINKNTSKNNCCHSLLYNIIHMDANNNENNNSYIKYFLYDYDFEDAIMYENRNFFNIFRIFLFYN